MFRQPQAAAFLKKPDQGADGVSSGNSAPLHSGCREKRNGCGGVSDGCTRPRYLSCDRDDALQSRRPSTEFLKQCLGSVWVSWGTNVGVGHVRALARLPTIWVFGLTALRHRASDGERWTAPPTVPRIVSDTWLRACVLQQCRRGCRR